MTGETRLELARRMYEAFASGDRAYIEAMFTEDFRFSSPLDVGLDRGGYFERCWPGSGQHRDPDLRRGPDPGGRGLLRLEPHFWNLSITLCS